MPIIVEFICERLAIKSIEALKLIVSSPRASIDSILAPRFKVKLSSISIISVSLIYSSIISF